MTFLFSTRLQILFWEIKNRFFYVIISFFLSFAVSYQNSTSLLYLFVLSYKKLNDSVFSEAEIFESSIYKAVVLGSNVENKSEQKFLLTFSEEVCRYEYGISDISFSNLLYFYKILKDIDISSISFIFTDVEEAFSSTILVCFIFSFITVLPFIFYEGLSFFVPSLYAYEKQNWLFRVISLTLLWYGFIYNVQNILIPRLADFLLKYQISSYGFSITGLPKIDSYCAWSITIFVGTSLIFFFFCLLFFCIIYQKIAIKYFTERRNLSRAFILLLSALIAPPEVQYILALVALFCFELAIYFFIFYKNLCKK